jgi:membrane-bound lytic murein transglycosylase D
MTRCDFRRAVLFALLPLVAACGSSLHNQARVVTTPTPPAQVRDQSAAGPSPTSERPGEDPVVGLIASSDQHFLAGQRELGLGHVEAARQEFNRSIEVLLESSYGRTEPRIREQFDRLVDRISADEIRALAQGDGFTERRSEPASIDDLLAVTTTFLPSRAATLKDTVQSDLRTDGHDIPIPLNQRVLSYIELFQGRLHEFIEEGMRRGSQYLPMIQNVFRAEGLPLDLAYVPLVESAFKPTALSRTKARGVWQFMAGTALENGLRRDWYIDERSDPEKATVAAAKYLATLSKLFDGDWHLALASYNSGPGRLQHALKLAPSADFWALSANPRLLPRETREYVPMILAAIVIARNPAQYGFDFAQEPARTFDKIMLDKPVDIRRIAEWSGHSVDEIQTLNPELRRWTTPVRDTQYELKVPTGTAEAVNSHLTESAEAELASLKWYVVKRGETLPAIAKKLHVSRADLAEANYLKATAALTPGQKLMVPHETGALVTARAERTVPAADAHATVNSGSGQLAEARNSDQTKIIYQIKQGDTLASIARLYKTTVASIRSWNPRLQDTRIVAGERLTIYTRAD